MFHCENSPYRNLLAVVFAEIEKPYELQHRNNHMRAIRKAEVGPSIPLLGKKKISEQGEDSRRDHQYSHLILNTRGDWERG